MLFLKPNKKFKITDLNTTVHKASMVYTLTVLGTLKAEARLSPGV